METFTFDFRNLKEMCLKIKILTKLKMNAYDIKLMTRNNVFSLVGGKLNLPFLKHAIFSYLSLTVVEMFM
jgi:hypothetical protein